MFRESVTQDKLQYIIKRCMKAYEVLFSFLMYVCVRMLVYECVSFTYDCVCVCKYEKVWYWVERKLHVLNEIQFYFL